MDVTESPLQNDQHCQRPHQSRLTSNTSQYHAQLYSEQKRLQNKLLQQTSTIPKKNADNMVRIALPTLTFDTPNLYRTSLKLSKEINIHLWWATVVELFSSGSFHASRVTLCVPQDASDPYNAPWGLKAAYDYNSGDNDNGEYRDNDDHSTTTATLEESGLNHQHKSRPSSSSSSSSTPPNATEPFSLPLQPPDTPSPKMKPKCFDHLQPLDANHEPLINNASIQQVLRRNDIVVLSREYRPQPTTTYSNRDPVKRALFEKRSSLVRQTVNAKIPLLNQSKGLVDLDSKKSLDGYHATASKTCFMADFDEYEQQQPSPWSHSPAPSPALMDLDVNPFFQSIPDIDDDAFNPDTSETKCTNSSIPFPPPASNAHSLIHIPLVHPPDLDDQHSTAASDKTKSYATPVGILSFLSPVVPYPAVLLKWLKSLQAFISSSLSNALAYSRMVHSRFDAEMTGSAGIASGRKPLLRRHSHKIKRCSSESFSNSSDSSNDTYSSSSSTPKTATGTSPPHLHSKAPKSTQLDNGIMSRSPTTATDNTLHQYAAPPSKQMLARNGLGIHDDDNRDGGTQLQEQQNVTSDDSANLLIAPMHDSNNTITTIPTTVNQQSTPDDHGYRQPTIPNNSNNKKYVTLRKCNKKQLGFNKKRRHSPMMNIMRQQQPSLTLNDHLRHTTMRRTRSKENVERLLESPKSNLLRLVVDGIPIHVFTCSTKTGQISWVNHRILQYTGKGVQDHLGPGWLSHMHPDDQTDFRQAWEVAFEQGNGFAGEYRLRRFDGAYRGFLWRIVPLRDIKGKIIHWFGTCTDVHDQQLAKENNLRQMEIESNERKYRLLADAIPQIVFTFSPGIGLTYANGKWENYSSQPFDCTKGLGFMSQVHQDDRHKLQLPELYPHKTAGVAWHTEIRLLGGDGCYRWFLVKCISVDELDTGDVRWFGTCTDINDHKLLEHKLKEAHNAAQKSTESKTRFLSNMSHEIRTPLIGITGMLNFLLDTDLTAEQLDYAHTIQQSAESLLVVINDILDLSKVEAGMMKLCSEPFNLVTMIEDANELLSTLAIQKGLELSFWVDDDIPTIVKGDRIRLRQVLLNLIGNAIKFTTYGEVYTRCKIQQMDTDKSELMLLFEVMDTGAGFDSDGEAVMFKPFSQVDSSSTRKHGGSGLGLVISRQLIELHGGEMKCKGKKGQGSTFSFSAKFEIPVANTRPQPQTPHNENVDPFFRTEAYKVVHDHNYRQELVQQQQKQHQEQQIHDQKRQQEQQILETNSNAGGHDAELSVSGRSQTTVFSPSPLAHSKRHSQANEAPPSTDRFQDALINKPVNMQLKQPPKRRQPVAQAPSPTPSRESAPSSATLNAPTIALHKSTISTPPFTAFSSPGLVKELSAPMRGCMSPNTAIIPPSHIPLRQGPLRSLVVCEWNYSRDTMERHVRRIVNELDSGHHYVSDVAKNVAEALGLLSANDSGGYDYVLVNLRSEQHILSLTSAICDSSIQHRTNIMIVTTPIQRSLLMEYVASGHYGDKDVIPENCGFVFKPLKRSKLNWYFGIRGTGSSITTANSHNGSNSNDSDHYSAPHASHRSATTQKEVFRKMEADVGGKGFRVLLVEDNLVNQKVLTRYLVRVGLLVDVANDGEECITYFMNKPYGYYSLILCDLFMPVKDGYETTREIRQWEEANIKSSQPRIPIVALSANVMSNVASKCLECGFSTYISKPVNFAILSDVIRSYLLPEEHLLPLI